MNIKNLPNLKLLRSAAANLAALVVLLLGFHGNAQTPSISSFGNITYVERQNSVLVAPNITISNGSNYSDGYLEFEVASAESSDQLGISTVATASTALNAISVVGTAVYRGDGSTANQIGSVDAFFNGQNGRKLRVNFSSPLTNAQFTEPVVNGQIPGWTLSNSRFFPSALTTWFPYTQGRAISASGSSPNITNTGIGYSFISDQNYASKGEGRANVSLTSETYQSGVVSDPNAVGGMALRLYSRLNVNLPAYQLPYGSSFGPVATSAPFTARQNDQLSLNWRASGSGDDYEVYAYLRNTSTSALTLLFYSRGGTRGWSTASGTIPANGTYEFIFINGSYDASGGLVLGAEFFIDNIRVVSAQAPNDANITALARLVAYNYTGCTPPATKSLTVRAYTANAVTGSGTNTINITEVNCAPTLTATALGSRVHTPGGAATTLFSSAVSSTQETGQGFSEWRLTYSGFVNAANEALVFDGVDIPMVNGTGTTTGNSINYTVSNGTITFTYPSGLWPGTFNNLINALAYKSLGAVTAGTRTVTLTYLQDNGGTSNGGTDATNLSINNTVSIANAAPVAGNFTINTESCTFISMQASDFVSAFSDANAGDTLQSIRVTSAPASGTLTLNGILLPLNQTIPKAQIAYIRYSSDVAGSFSFNYQVSDGNAWSANGVASLAVAAGSGLAVNTTVGTTRVAARAFRTTVDSLITVSFPGTINGARVSIETGFNSGDQLVMPQGYVYPSGVTGSYNATAGVFTVSGNMTAAEMQDIFKKLQFTTTSTVLANREIAFIIGSALYEPFSGHYYEIISGPESIVEWEKARVRAKYLNADYGGSLVMGNTRTATTPTVDQDWAVSNNGLPLEPRTINGLQGYLANITTLDEHQFLRTRLTGTGWLGGSDIDLEGTWRWMDGPEKGQIFWQGNSTVRRGTNTINGVSMFNYWSDNEPNNAGGEHWAEFGFGNSGVGSSWNDCQNNCGGRNRYVIEYGGMPGDITSPSCFNGTARKQLEFNQRPTISSVSNQVTCPAGTYPATTFTVGDTEDTASLLAVTATSDRQSLVPNANIVITGTGASRTVQVTHVPGQVSFANITLTVRDAEGETASTTFMYVNTSAAPVFSYTAPNNTVLAGETTLNLAPSISSGTITRYAINPTVSTYGLSFNTNTGVISGIPNQGFTTTFTITGTDTASGCPSTTTLTLDVLECYPVNAGDYVLRGSANQTALTANYVEYQLTPAAGNRFGAAWNQRRLDLTQDFNIISQVNLGSNDASGADGLAFVLQPLSTNQGSSGGGLGYAGITPSFSVEFDTWQNSGDPSQDHIALMLNGNTANHGQVAGTSANTTLGNLEDGQWRSAQYIWTAATKNLRVIVAGNTLFNITYDLVANVFNGNPNVYWGYTAATGGSVNDQRVRFERYCLERAANSAPQVTTDALIAQTGTTATIATTVQDGGDVLTARGVIFSSSNQTPQLGTAGAIVGASVLTSGGADTTVYASLLPGTLYYARAYATNSLGTTYGNVISFWTAPQNLSSVTTSNFLAGQNANIICFGDSTQLQATGVQGQVHWFTSSCGGTQVGTGNNLTVQPTVTTTYYGRNFYNGLYSDACLSLTVVVRDQVVAPVINGAEIICWNSRPTGFTGTAATGGSGPWTYQWQQREFINGVWGAWTNIAQANNFAAYRPDFMYTTTEFRLLATDSGSPACTTDVSSNVITVTVRDPFTPSVISVNNGAYTFCQNDQLTLTATPTLGGSGPPFQYQWQQSVDSINWVNVGPAQNNQIDLVINNLSADTYYRLIAFDLGTPGCGSVFSINGFKVYVQPTVLAGNISGSQHICAQTTPAAISSIDTGSGRGTLSYRWEASIDGGNTWNTIAGANAASYQPGVMTTTTDFRRYTISTFQGLACESPLASDSIIRILVDSLPIAQVFGQLRDTACVASPYQIAGGYSSNGIRAWSHNGAGSLSSTTDLQPVYTPVPADAGQVVRFTMVVTGTTICNLTTDTAIFELYIDSLPYAIAGFADTICSNGTYQVVGASAAYGTVQWTHNGAGTLQQANTLTPTYVAAVGDEGNHVQLVLSVTSDNTCAGSVHRDTISILVDPLPQAAAGGSDTICSGASSVISGASAAHGTILWTIDAASGNGTLVDETTLTPTYMAAASDAGSTVRLKMTVTSTNVCHPQVAVAYFDVVVRPDFVPAALTNQNQELCYNTTARVLTAQAATGGSGPYAYQWQVSNDSLSWTNINGANTLTYSPVGVQVATRYYRILSTDLGNPVCGTTLPSAQAASVVVFDPLTPPLFSSNVVTLCSGTSATLLPAPARGGRNDFLYQWQQSANGTSGWVNVGTPSANLAFNTPNMTSGTYYRVIARDQDFPNGDPSCGSTFSNAVRIIVANPVTAGAIAGDQTICLGSSAAILQSTTAGTGSGTVSYAWEADAGQGWARIAGATAATYDPGALAITTQFRRITVATLNGVDCESTASNVVTVTVDDPAVFAASAQGDTTLMAGSNGCTSAGFNYLTPATGPSAITYTYSFSGATVDTGAGTGAGSIFNLGLTTVNVYAATNCSVTVHTFDVTVMDTVRPTVVAQNLTVNLDANGQASITPAMVDNGSSDNCGIATRTLSSSNFSCANVGANQVILTVTDVNGNVQTAPLVVTVVDAVLPTVVAQNLSIQLDVNGQASITPAMVDNGSSDNCGIASMSLSQTNFDCSHVGANNVTLTVTDVNGNVNQAQVVVTVSDTLRPIVIAQNLTVQLDANGQASITPAMVDNGSTDNCAIATRTLDMSSFSCAHVGANNVTLTVTDVNGNLQAATVVVTVLDTLKPIVIAQNLTVNLDSNGQASITPAMVDNGSSDNCGIATRTLSSSNFSCANVGANQVILTVTDVNGNVQTAAVVVTVVDADTPVVAVQNRTVYLDSNGVGQLTAAQVDAGTSDNCGITQLSLSQTQFGCSDIGLNNLLFAATDVNGNVSRSIVQVSVLDTIAPVVTRFAADTLYVTRDACASLYYWRDSISVYDACGGFTVQSNWPNVILLNKGQHQLNFTVTDLYGNARSYSRPVVVIDTISPVIRNIPANVTLYATNNCGLTYTWVQPSPSDNCTGVTMTSNFNSGDFFPLGTTVVNFMVTDAVGLTNQASFTITVLDTTPPIIASRNATIYLGSNGQASLSLPEVLTATTTDNCGVQSVQLSQNTFNCNEVGTNQVNIRAVDVNGNTRVRSVEVTVLDTIKPVVTAQNLTVHLNASGQASITPAMVDNGSTDNCGIATRTLSSSTFSCANVGANNVTFTVTDVNGNAQTATLVVTVLDTVKPIVVAQNLTVHLNTSGQASITPAMVDNGSADNCGIATRTLSNSTFSCANIGANNVTLTVTDVNGNVQAATVVVTVLDTVKPTVIAQNLTVHLNASGQASITPAMVDNGSSDNCGIATRSLSTSTFSCANVGANNVTLTVTDVNGNVQTASVVVTVIDNLPPVAIAQNLTVYLNAAGQAIVTAAAVNNGSSDNCGIGSMSLSTTNFSCANRGQNTVTFTVTDLQGNSASTTASILVLDTIAPNIQLAVDTIVAYLANNQCVASVNLTGIQATDNCGTPSFTTSPISGAAFAVGVTPVLITASDASGNHSQRTMYVRVIDTISPMIVGVPNNVNFVYDSTLCGAYVSWVSPIAIDNCGATLGVSQLSGTFFGLGSHTVTFTATDANGNIAQQSIQFTVVDQSAPVWVTVPQPIVTAALNGQCGANVSWNNPVASDNCGNGQVTIISSHASGSFFPVGVTTVTLTARDAAGNLRQTQFTITVNDLEAPVVVSAPSHIVKGICDAGVVYNLPVATDNCGAVTVLQTAGLASGSVFPLGTTTNTFEISDASGNATTVSFTVTILNAALPYQPMSASYCSADPIQDLANGYSGYSFFGNGVVNGNYFNPALASIGNQVIDYIYTDSLNCRITGRIVISVFPNPSKPIIDRVNATTLKVRDPYSSYQWYRYGQPIPGATQQTLVVTLSGIYDVVVGNQFGCTTPGDPYGFGVGIGVNELKADEFVVYPNPNKGIFFVRHNKDDMMEREVLVYDMMGKVVHRVRSNTVKTEIDLMHLAQGKYFIRIASEPQMGIKSVIIQY